MFTIVDNLAIAKTSYGNKFKLIKSPVNSDYAVLEYTNKSKKIKDLDKYILLDNEPQVGFQIVNYSSSSCSNNKWWAIYDPRGFKVLIASDGFYNSVTNAEIKNGVFTKPCFWARKNSAFVLVEVDSEQHKQYKNDVAVRTAEKIKAKDLKIGAHYKNKAGVGVFYMGKISVHNDIRRKTSYVYESVDKVKENEKFYVFARLEADHDSLKVKHYFMPSPMVYLEDNSATKKDIYRQVKNNSDKFFLYDLGWHHSWIFTQKDNMNIADRKDFIWYMTYKWEE